jgi:hypothetical protein
MQLKQEDAACGSPMINLEIYLISFLTFFCLLAKNKNTFADKYTQLDQFKTT